VLPRWLAILTWAVAVVLLLNAILGWWVMLIFPVWVFLISIYILSVSQRIKSAS
jgi:TctA family transporter